MGHPDRSPIDVITWSQFWLAFQVRVTECPVVAMVALPPRVTLLAILPAQTEIQADHIQADHDYAGCE